MSIEATASEVRTDFDRFQERAMKEPVRVTRDGRETVFIVSAERYHELRQAEREALHAHELDDATLAAIEAAEIPAAERYSSDRVD